MKTRNKAHSYPTGDSVARRLTEALPQATVEQVARQTRFQRRQPKKLSPMSFLLSCFGLILPQRISYRTWAMVVGLVTGLLYSKQALFKRITPAALRFVQGLLQLFLVRASLGVQRCLPPGLDQFERVLIQDSVIVTLPNKLARWFSGARNQTGYHGAQVRVQAVLDLKDEQYVGFWHSRFGHNDLKAAAEGLEGLRRGDLLLRDLGYFVLGVFGQLIERGIHFISRFKLNVSVFDLKGQPLDLAKLLKARGWLDQAVLLGAQEQLRVRLVALKVPQAEAARRRRVARANRHYQPSAQHLLLLGWNLFITDLKRQEMPAKTVAKVYRLRWRVEVHFKAWKQFLHLEDVPAGSPLQVQVLLYARLLLISLFEVFYVGWWDYRLDGQGRPAVSLLKMAAALPLCLVCDLLQAFQANLKAALDRQIAYHCVYESRTRANFIDMLYN